MDMDVIYPTNLSTPRRTGGLTLIELLIVVAIASILLGIAAPSFSGIIQNSRMTGEFNTLAGHLNYARSEAIKRGRNVIVCKSHDGMNCTTSGDWTEGWIVFPDINDNRSRDNAEPLLTSQQPPGDNISISYGGFPTSNYVLYYSIGTSLGNGTFTFCDSRGEENAKALVLYKTGRLRTSSTMPNGNQLSCPPA
jgi:type IV fimbrial biogenesis protein FimT